MMQNRDKYEVPVWITGVVSSKSRRITILRVLNTRDLTVCITVPSSLIVKYRPSGNGASSFEYLVPQWLAHKHKLSYAKAMSLDDITAYTQRREERRSNTL